MQDYSCKNVICKGQNLEIPPRTKRRPRGTSSSFIASYGQSRGGTRRETETADGEPFQQSLNFAVWVTLALHQGECLQGS